MIDNRNDGQRELVTVTEPGRRRLLTPCTQGVVQTTDERGRIISRECDRDLIEAAMAEHYRRRTH